MWWRNEILTLPKISHLSHFNCEGKIEYLLQIFWRCEMPFFVVATNSFVCQSLTLGKRPTGWQSSQSRRDLFPSSLFLCLRFKSRRNVTKMAPAVAISNNFFKQRRMLSVLDFKNCWRLKASVTSKSHFGPFCLIFAEFDFGWLAAEGKCWILESWNLQGKPKLCFLSASPSPRSQ